MFFGQKFLPICTLTSVLFGRGLGGVIPAIAVQVMAAIIVGGRYLDSHDNEFANKVLQELDRFEQDTNQQ